MSAGWIEQWFPAWKRRNPVFYIDKDKAADTTTYTMGGRRCGKTARVKELMDYAISIGCAVTSEGVIICVGDRQVELLAAKGRELGLR